MASDEIRKKKISTKFRDQSGSTNNKRVQQTQYIPKMMTSFSQSVMQIWLTRKLCAWSETRINMDIEKELSTQINPAAHVISHKNYTTYPPSIVHVL